MIEKAILKINPSAEFSVNAEDYNQITWLNGTTPILKSDIEVKITELETAYTNNKYQRDRAIAYPTWQEQMDMQYKDLLNGTTTWKDTVAKVKLDNPK